MTVPKRSQPPPSPSCWDSDDSEAFPPSRNRTPSPQEPRTPPPCNSILSSWASIPRSSTPPRTPSPPSHHRSPRNILTQGRHPAVSSTSGSAQRNHPSLFQSLRDLPPIPRRTPLPSPTPSTPTAVQRQRIRQAYNKSKNSLRTIQRIDDRSAIGIARAPIQKSIQCRKNRVAVARRARRGIFCNDCKVHCPTQKHYDDHLKTDKHNRTKVLKPYRCTICSFTDFPPEDYDRHINGKKHRNNYTHSGKLKKYSHSTF